MALGHLITHGAWVKRLIVDGHVPGKNYIQVGLRGYYPYEESFDWMRKEGFRYHTMAEIERRGWEAVMEDIIKEANDGPEYLYFSFDIDTLDPAFVPGTGTPEPGGLTPRHGLISAVFCRIRLPTSAALSAKMPLCLVPAAMTTRLP